VRGHRLAFLAAFALPLVVAGALAFFPKPPSTLTGTGDVTSAGRAPGIDLRQLPQVGGSAGVPTRDGVKEREGPDITQTEPVGQPAPLGAGKAPSGPSAPAPNPLTSFEGLHFDQMCGADKCGAGHPPDTNGDVGPVYYLQTINTALGIFNKSTGTLVAGITIDALMSQGSFGNLCDTDNFGDPVVLYDTFHDRWIVTDFAFQVDPAGNIVSPPGSFQCFAVSMTGDPVSGGWNFYSLHITDALQDYPKFGIWTDGLYMSANLFDFAAGGAFKNVRVWALNLAQMEAGTASVQSVSFNVPVVQQQGQKQIAFALLPSNARLQTGTPPAGRPNLFVGEVMTSTSIFVDRLRVWKFHVDWNNTLNSTFGSQTTSNTTTGDPNNTWLLAPDDVPSGTGGNTIDTLGFRPMMQNQYTNINGVESLWDSHSVQGSSATQSAVRWYQIPVTGGTVGSALQAATWNPTSANRFMPSLAVNRLGDMAIGYSVSGTSLFPSIRYAGRLAGSAVNTLPLTEATLINGTGTQVGNCGPDVCHRWGDYSAMTLDPDGCTFWYTNEYYATNGLDHHTRIGSFKYSGCSPLPPPTPSPTPTATPTATATATASPTPSPTPTPTPTPTKSPSPTPSPTSTPTPTPTASPTSTPTPTPTKSPSPTPSPTQPPQDTTPPTVSAPVTVIAPSLQLLTTTSAIPLRVSWSGTDASGVASFNLQQSQDGAAFVDVTLNSPTDTVITLFRAPDHSYAYRVRATDTKSNTSGFVAGPTSTMKARQETSSYITYAGTWTQVSSTSAYGGGIKYAKTSTATATFSFTGRAIAWVAPIGPFRGAVDVYIDGAFLQTVDLFAATFQPRMTVFTRSWATSSTHSIQLRVKATPTRPRADVDAFVVLK
jgi:hypothetical protein